MNIEHLQQAVYRAHVELAASGLVMGTFGNLSAADREAGVFVIKPSGVPYDRLTPAHMVPVSLETGEVVGSDLRPSSDTPTHLELYRAFGCGAVVHTHSEYATLFAQVRTPIRCMGTTHADYFRGDIPVTRSMTRRRSGAGLREEHRPGDRRDAGGARRVAGRNVRGPRRQSRAVHLGRDARGGRRARARCSSISRGSSGARGRWRRTPRRRTAS